MNILRRNFPENPDDARKIKFKDLTSKMVDTGFRVESSGVLAWMFVLKRLEKRFRFHKQYPDSSTIPYYLCMHE
jgi:hypothetical protein